MSMSVDGVWASGVWAETVWGDCVWFEPGCVTEDIPVKAPEPSSGGAAWPSREQYRKKKRQAILDDDEELMRIIAMSLPELIKRYRDG